MEERRQQPGEIWPEARVIFNGKFIKTKCLLLQDTRSQDLTADFPVKIRISGKIFTGNNNDFYQ